MYQYRKGNGPVHRYYVRAAGHRFGRQAGDVPRHYTRAAAASGVQAVFTHYTRQRYGNGQGANYSGVFLAWRYVVGEMPPAMGVSRVFWVADTGAGSYYIERSSTAGHTDEYSLWATGNGLIGYHDTPGSAMQRAALFAARAFRSAISGNRAANGSTAAAQAKPRIRLRMGRYSGRMVRYGATAMARTNRYQLRYGHDDVQGYGNTWNKAQPSKYLPDRGSAIAFGNGSQHYDMPGVRYAGSTDDYDY